MQQTKLLLAAAVLAAFSLTASAQTNTVTVTNVVTTVVTNVVTITNVVAAPPVPAAVAALALPAKSPWNSSISAGLTLTRGNSDTLLASAGVLTHKKTPTNEISLGADGAYGTSGSEKNVDTVHAFGQYNHLFTDRFYGYARVEGLHDGIADLQYRLTVGPGAGYYFIKEKNTTLSGEFGASFVNQRLGDETDNYATLRLAESFEHKFQSYGARIWENVEILPQVNQFNNYIVNAELGIESALSKSLSLRTVLVDNFNNEPAAGRQKNDVKLVSGITYKF